MERRGSNRTVLKAPEQVVIVSGSNRITGRIIDASSRNAGVRLDGKVEVHVGQEVSIVLQSGVLKGFVARIADGTVGILFSEPRKAMAIIGGLL